VNLTSRVSHSPARPSPAPAELLGADHPLVRDLERLEVARTQCIVVAALFAGAMSAWLSGSSGALEVVAAAAIAGILVACRVAMLLASRRLHVLELISRGRGDLPIPAIARVCAQLRRPRHCRRLVRSIETLLDSEAHAFDFVVMPWQFPDSELVAAVRHELRQIAALLSEPGAAMKGVAGMERLLFDGTSCLHGDDAHRLREELRRIRFLLSAYSGHDDD
jgi:hypothetical protein